MPDTLTIPAETTNLSSPRPGESVVIHVGYIRSDADAADVFKFRFRVEHMADDGCELIKTLVSVFVSRKNGDYANAYNAAMIRLLCDYNSAVDIEQY